jgi:hypothetical protein
MSLNNQTEAKQMKENRGLYDGTKETVQPHMTFSSPGIIIAATKVHGNHERPERQPRFVQNPWDSTKATFM